MCIPLIPARGGKSDAPVFTIQRKGSMQRGKLGTMESIQESKDSLQQSDESDQMMKNSLTVPKVISPGNMLAPSEQVKTPFGSRNSSRRSSRRSSKQGTIISYLIVKRFNLNLFLT